LARGKIPPDLSRILRCSPQFCAPEVTTEGGARISPDDEYPAFCRDRGCRACPSAADAHSFVETCPLSLDHDEGRDVFLIGGYEVLHRVVRPGGSSARANLPRAWAGEEVAVVRKTRKREEGRPPRGGGFEWPLTPTGPGRQQIW